MRIGNLVWALLAFSTSAVANPGPLLAKITSTSADGVRTCEVYSKRTKVTARTGRVTTRETHYTENASDLYAVRDLIGDAWGHFRKVMISDHRNIEIVGYDDHGEEKMLYFITGSGRSSVLSHEMSATGTTVFNFILENCPQFDLPWITM